MKRACWERRVVLVAWDYDFQIYWPWEHKCSLLNWICRRHKFCERRWVDSCTDQCFFFFFWGWLFFHKSILSSHILLVVNRIMMGIIFTNLTEKTHVPAFNFSLFGKWTISRVFPVGQRGEKAHTGYESKKQEEKHFHFLRRQFGLITETIPDAREGD